MTRELDENCKSRPPEGVARENQDDGWEDDTVSEVSASMEGDGVRDSEPKDTAPDVEYAELVGREISAGHAFEKHVVEQGEFPGVATRQEFANVIEDTVMKGESRDLSNGRTAYWNDGIVVIRDPGSEDGGTAFRPPSYDYFKGLY
jgi:hypothetical protein